MKQITLPIIIILSIIPTVCSDPIHDAARLGNLELVQAELGKGVDINFKDSEYGGTPLHFAAYGGALNVVKFLLANEAEVDVGNNQGWTALFYASDEGHLHVVEFLIDNNASVKWRDNDLRRAYNFAEEHKEVQSLLLDNIEDSIFKAAELGDINSIKGYIEQGVNLNERQGSEYGFTPLHFAVHSNRVETVEFLIGKGANVNIVDWWGRTPLFFVIRSRDGNHPLLGLLLENGADINARDATGATVLHYASLYDMRLFNGRKRPDPLAVELIEYGAKVNVRDDNGTTPLDWAYYQLNQSHNNMQLLSNNGGRKGEDELQHQLKLLQQSFTKLQHLIIPEDDNQSISPVSIEKLQGVFVVKGEKGKDYEVEYHHGDNNWKMLKRLRLASKRQLFIDSSSFDEKRFYRVKLAE